MINTYRLQDASLSKFQMIIAEINTTLTENRIENQNVYLTGDLI